MQNLIKMFQKSQMPRDLQGGGGGGGGGGMTSFEMVHAFSSLMASGAANIP